MESIVDDLIAFRASVNDKRATHVANRDAASTQILALQAVVDAENPAIAERDGELVDLDALITKYQALEAPAKPVEPTPGPAVVAVDPSQ